MRSIIIPLCSFMLVAGCVTPPVLDEWAPNGVAIDSIAVNDFTLQTSENETWNWELETKDRVVAVAFLFTNCLDICPVVTYNMNWVASQLTQDERNETVFLTITVDPWRDNLSTLDAWKNQTKSDWDHLTTQSAEESHPMMNELESVWQNFGVGLSIETNSSLARHHPGDYTVNHSTGTVLIDKNGNQRVWWGDNDWVLDLFLEDLRTLLS